MKMSNKYAEISKVKIRTLNKNGRTILDDVYVTSPFKIAHPFYKSDDYKMIAQDQTVQNICKVNNVSVQEATQTFLNQGITKDLFHYYFRHF